jgi:CBS domain-containing protein
VRVQDIMSPDVVTVRGDDTFGDVAKTLRDHAISSVVVTDGGSPAGIITERDFVNLIANGVDPATTRVADRMTRDLATVGPKSDVTEAARIMAERRIRHLPVVTKNRLVGIISIRDLTSWAVGEFTGGHELPDLERSSAALSAAVEIDRLA